MTGKSFKTLIVIMSLLIGFTAGALAGILYMQNLSWNDTPVFLESKSGEIFEDVQKIEVFGDGVQEIEADLYKFNIVIPKAEEKFASQQISTSEQLIEHIRKDLSERKIDQEKIHLALLKEELPETMSIQLSIRDREIVEQIVEYLILIGITGIREVELDSAHLEEGKQQSAIAAMQDAREKANFIAGTEGKKIKGIFSIEYNPTSQIKITRPILNNITLEPGIVDSLLSEKIKIESNIRVNYKF